MYEILEGNWQTPGGHTAHFRYRADTNDWNTISACLVNALTGSDGDEYHLPQGLSGWALDLGAHIGAVTVGLALDNPDLRVVAIEAVPANVTLLRANIALNGLEDRCTVMAGAAWSSGRSTTRIEYGYEGTETATHNAFIGSVSPWLEKVERQYTNVPTVTLRQALAATDGTGFVWVKSDCEGCEHRFLKGPGLAKVGQIEGEWHRRDGSPEAFAAQLAKTHDVQWTEGIGGGPFTAVRR